MQRLPTRRLEPGSGPILSTSDKGLHDFPSHTSGAGLLPPGRGEVLVPRREHPWRSRWGQEAVLSATTSNKLARTGLGTHIEMSDKGLHDLPSPTSGTGLLPPGRGEMTWPCRRAPLVEQVRAVGCFECNDLQQAG